MIKLVHLSVAMAVAVAAPAMAEEVNLRFVTTIPATMNVSVDVFHPWAARINGAGQGAVRIEVLDGPAIANGQNWYSRLTNDVIQVGWGILGFVSGVFNVSNVAALPLEVENAEQGSVAFWRTYKAGLLDADFSETVPLVLLALPQNSLHFAKAPRSIENLNGLKIASGSKFATDIIGRLGGAGVSLTTAEYYEALQRRTVDGILTPWTAIEPFKLQEVTFYHVDTQLAGAIGGILMTKKRYNALPDTARNAIEANGGEAESRKWGVYWDGLQAHGRQMAKTTPQHTLVSPTPEQASAWRKVIAPVTDEWLKATPNGDKALQAFHANIVAVQTQTGK